MISTPSKLASFVVKVISIAVVCLLVTITLWTVLGLRDVHLTETVESLAPHSNYFRGLLFSLMVSFVLGFAVIGYASKSGLDPGGGILAGIGVGYTVGIGVGVVDGLLYREAA